MRRQRDYPVRAAVQCLIDKSDVLDLVGKNDDAAAAARGALALAAIHGDRQLSIDSLLQLCGLNSYTPDVEVNIRRCLAHCQVIGYLKGIARCHNLMGFVFNNDGDYRQGIQYYAKAAEYNRNAGNLLDYSICISNIGQSYYTLGEYATAERYHLQALSIAEHTGAVGMQAYVFHNIASARLVRGEYQAALDQFRKAEAINQRIGDRRNQANNLHQIAYIHHVLGDTAQALQCLSQAEGIKRTMGDQWALASSLNLTSRILIDAGAIDQAAQYLDEGDEVAAIVENPDLYSRLAVTRGELTLARNELAQATSSKDRAFALAVQTGIKNGKAEALLLWAKIDAVCARHQDAAPRFRDALALYQEMNDLFDQGVVRYHYGASLAANGGPESAREMLAASAGTFQAIGAKGWLARAEAALAALDDK